MQLDVDLRKKPGFWETPRNLVILLGAFAAIVAIVAGLAGYTAGQIASTPSQIIFQPGSIVVQQPAVTK